MSSDDKNANLLKTQHRHRKTAEVRLTRFLALGGAAVAPWRFGGPPKLAGLPDERRRGAPSASEDDADRLYADRANLASAKRAAELWSADLASNPEAFDAAWKLARVDYWLGGHAPQSERRAHLENGIGAARKAVAAERNRPEGHFWIAANMGTLAESFGLRAGLRYRGPVKQELGTVLRLDPAFMDGSADRVLGRWYFRVPRLFGGSNKRAEEHLRASLKYDDQSTVSHFFLAELLIDEGRKAEARAELQKVLDAPLSAEWAPEDAEYKEKARALLSKVK